MKTIRVAELFAGVGGFRVGLERASKNVGSGGFKVVWSNQWEPGSSRQEASEIYVKNFGRETHSNEDIATVETDRIPDHDLLVGGFPCQDYSVARTLSQAKGLRGKKGVLWWQIHRILKEKKKKPKYLLLENVDRLLKSPASQRGRDFAIMLASLSELGYIVEWRVINAAEYGMPQRRRRVFFIGYHKTSNIYGAIKKLEAPLDWILKEGPLAEAFNVKADQVKGHKSLAIEGDLAEISKKFNLKGHGKSPFENTGIMIHRKVWTIKTKPTHEGPFTCLGDILLPEVSIPSEFYIDDSSVRKWKYLKGSKNEKRVNGKNGFEYHYNEGSMIFPDPLDKPSRTIVTGEGGATPSRFKHVVSTPDGKMRRLTPIELERLNMFPDDHTKGASDIKRAFFMGNALVVGVIERIGKTLLRRVL